MLKNKLHEVTRLEYQLAWNKVRVQLSPHTKNANPKAPKVLLVEDNLIIQEINRSFLESLGCNVDVTDKGSKAIAKFKNYDLLLLDIGLADIDGIQVCKKIRQKEIDKHIPIIAITAYGDSIEAECRAAGVDDFAVKPVLLDKMEQLIRPWLNQGGNNYVNFKQTDRRKANYWR